MAGENNTVDPVKEVQTAFAEFKTAIEENAKKRDVVTEEKIEKLNKHMDRFEGMNQEVVKAVATQKAQQEQLDKIEAAINRGALGGGGGSDKSEAEKEEAAYKATVWRSLRKAQNAQDPADLAMIQKRVATLKRSDDAGAGYLLAPPDNIKEIVKDIVEMSPMRSLATVRLVGGSSLKIPKRTSSAGAATRVGEVANRTNTGDPAYGMIEIQSPELYARAEISQQMLEDEGYDLEAELREEFSEQFAKKEGAEFISGVGGANQAEGILTNSGVGEVVSGHATAITADGLIGLFYELKTGYGANARFLLARSTIAAIRKLKDGDGNYLWAPGIAGVAPNTILGAVYVEMPDMPAIGAGTYPVAFGDFRRGYVVADKVAMSFQSDFITGADNGVVVYRARKRVGGGVRQADAIKKLKIAAA